MNSILGTPILYGHSARPDELVKLSQSHVKDNLIQVDFKVKQNRMPKFSSTYKLGPLISYWMDFRGINNAELARKMGVKPPFISIILHNKSGLSIGALEALIQALNIEPETFFSVTSKYTAFAKPKINSQEKKKIA